MVNSHVTVSTRKGLNCFVWFVVSEKRGKWELLNHYRIIMNSAWSKCLIGAATQYSQGKYPGEAMWFSNEELLSSVKCRTRTNSFHLTHICCPSAFTDENYGGMSWQELNWGKCKSDTPCLVQSVWVQEWRQSQSNKNSWQ